MPRVVNSAPLPSNPAFRANLSPRSVSHDGALVEVSTSCLREQTSTGGMVVSELPLPENIPSPCELSFTVFPKASKAMSDLLIDSEGYSYTRKRVNKKSTRWACTHRPKVQPCPAAVHEVGFSYTRTVSHSHAGVEDLFERKLFRQKVLTNALHAKTESACAIVETQVLEERGEGKDFLPVLSNEVRAINRARMKLRPPKPDNLVEGSKGSSTTECYADTCMLTTRSSIETLPDITASDSPLSNQDATGSYSSVSV